MDTNTTNQNPDSEDRKVAVELPDGPDQARELIGPRQGFEDLDNPITIHISSFIDGLDTAVSWTSVNQALHALKDDIFLLAINNMLSIIDQKITKYRSMTNQDIGNVEEKERLDSYQFPKEILHKLQEKEIVDKEKEIVVEEKEIVDKEKIIVYKLINKYPAVFKHLCKSQPALSLIKNVGYASEPLSRRMVNLFKLYLYAYASEKPFGPKYEGFFTEVSKRYCTFLYEFPHLERIGLRDYKASKPTAEEWAKIYNDLKEKYNADLHIAIQGK